MYNSTLCTTFTTMVKSFEECVTKSTITHIFTMLHCHCITANRPVIIADRSVQFQSLEITLNYIKALCRSSSNGLLCHLRVRQVITQITNINEK